MEIPACTFQIDHNGSVVRIVGNKSGLQALAQELTSFSARYESGQTIPLMNSALCIHQGGTDIVEYVCDDSIKSEKNS